MYSAKYLMERFTTIPSDALTGYETIWRDPVRLGPDSWVFATSYSGNTEDTMPRCATPRAGRAHDWYRQAPRDTIKREADVLIDYDSTALYILPLATVYLSSRWKWRACRGTRRLSRSSRG